MKFLLVILILTLLINTAYTAAKSEKERIEINCHYDNLNNDKGKKECIVEQTTALSEISEWMRVFGPKYIKQNNHIDKMQNDRTWNSWISTEAGKLYLECKSKYKPDNVAVSFCIGAR